MGFLDQWLWKDTFPLPTQLLEVDEEHIVPEEELDNQDFLSLTAGLMAELAQVEDSIRRPLRTPQPADPSGAKMKRVARQMLPILDALDRLIDYSNQNESNADAFDNWLKAMEGVSERVNQLADSIGLSAIDGVGIEVDLEIHDVVETRPTGDQPDSTVLEIRQKGYYFEGKLLRDAKVVVALAI